MSYRIKSVATLTGIAATTLRAWERRYDLVSPRRTDSGYRVYSEEDVATLTQVKALVDRGYKVGEAIEMVRRGTPPLPPADIASEELSSIGEELLGRLLEMDRSGAMQIYDRLAALPYDRQLDEVLLPMLREVGERWHRGDATVAQEHFTSVFARGRLVGMLESLSDGGRRGREVVCAGMPGEVHEMGLMSAAIHLAMRGWRVVYLGMDVPLDDLRGVVRSREPQLLCSSVMLRRPADECLEMARTLREMSPHGTLVVLGGAGLAEELPPEPFEDTFLIPRLSDMLELPELAAA